MSLHAKRRKEEGRGKDYGKGDWEGGSEQDVKKLKKQKSQESKITLISSSIPPRILSRDLGSMK